MKIMQNVQIIKSTQEELLVLDRLGEEYKIISEMSDQDRAFLNSLILRKKPKKIVEIGVAKGGSSLIILNAIKDNPDAYLYSCDYLEDCYSVPGKKTGFYVNEFPELKEKWSLFTGGLSLSFLDEIGTGIDFCLIDTMHINPGEILDCLMVLPYLNKDATVVFHDTNLCLYYECVGYESRCYTNALLMSALSGEKLIPSNEIYKSLFGNYNYFSNIGAVEINENTFKNIYEIFNLLTIQWSYMPSETDLAQFLQFLERFYDEYYVKFFKEVINWQKGVFQQRKIFETSTLEREKEHKHNYTFWEKIFSIRNESKKNKDYYHKVICIFGIKIKFRINK